jgi:hypothetical protein
MSTYHLHIPRTSGVYTREMLLSGVQAASKVTGHRRTLSIDAFSKADLISGHYGITPCEYVDRTFTVIRNPNELTFSYIKYVSLIKGPNAFNEDHLKKYLYEDNLRDSVTNVLSSFLSRDLDIPRYNSRIGNLPYLANNSWHLKPSEVSVESAVQSIENYNIKLFFYGRENLTDSIAEYLGISADHTRREKINGSPDDVSNLYEKYFSEIEKANNIDNDLYRKLLSDYALS